MNDLSKLPATAWVLIACAAALGFGAALAWRWYRQYRARKALRVAVTGGAADHLVDRLFYRSFKLQGRYEFPPFLGMFIEQMLYLL